MSGIPQKIDLGQAPWSDFGETTQPLDIESAEFTPDEQAVYDCIPEAIKSSYGKTPREILKNFVEKFN